MRRLLLVVPNVVSYTSFLDELATAAVARGAEVLCACATDALFALPEGRTLAASLLRIPAARGLDPLAHLRAARSLRDLVSRHRPDVVHAHLSAAVLTTALARERGWPPTIATFQGLAFPLTSGARGRAIRAAERWAAGRMDEAWVLTADDEVSLRAAAPAATVRRQESAGFGCDLDRFDAARFPEGERAALRAGLGLDGDDFVCAFVGRQVAFKGFAVTVRAFLAAARERPRLRLVLVGGRDPLHPSGLTPVEEQELAASPLARHVAWSDEVDRYLAISDLVVFPSEREGMPVSLMEALAMGVPVITRDARGCRDVVRHEVDGLVLGDAGESEIAAAIIRLADDRTLVARMRANALAGRERFARSAYVAEQLSIYEQLLTKHSAPSDA